MSSVPTWTWCAACWPKTGASHSPRSARTSSASSCYASLSGARWGSQWLCSPKKHRTRGTLKADQVVVLRRVPLRHSAHYLVCQMPCRVVACHLMPHYGMPHRAVSFHGRSCHSASSHFRVTRATISCHIMACHIVPCRFMEDHVTPRHPISGSPVQQSHATLWHATSCRVDS